MIANYPTPPRVSEVDSETYAGQVHVFCRQIGFQPTVAVDVVVAIGEEDVALEPFAHRKIDAYAQCRHDTSARRPFTYVAESIAGAHIEEKQ